MISLTVMKGFLKKEFRQVLRDPRMRVLLFVAPVIQLIIFGVAISTDVKNLKLWAPVEVNDTILQHIYQHSIASGWFIPITSNRNDDPFELLRSGRADAALIPPPGGLTKSVGRGTANLQFLVNAMNVIQAQATEQYMKSIIDQVLSTDLKTPLPESPIKFVPRVLYNPTLETSYFMIPGVISLLICILTIVLSCMSITREKEMGTFEMLISAPLSATEIILGKTIPFLILGMIDVPFILMVAIFIFHVPMQGSFFVLLLVSFVFICTTVAIGTLISTFAKNQQQSTLGSFLFLFPAILLSGLLFPLENMPEVMKWFSYLDPISHYLALLRNIMLKGGDASFILWHTGALCLMGIILIYISFKRFHTTLQ